MKDQKKINRQERWTRKWGVPFIQEKYGNEWHVSSGMIADEYDIQAFNPGKHVNVLIECKEWGENPEEYRCLLIKKSKVDGMIHRARTFYHPDDFNDIDVDFKLAYMVFFTGTCQAYMVSLDDIEQCDLRNLRQKKVNWDDKPEYVLEPTYFIPIEKFHKASIREYMDKYGYNCYAHADN